MGVASPPPTRSSAISTFAFFFRSSAFFGTGIQSKKQTANIATMTGCIVLTPNCRERRGKLSKLFVSSAMARVLTLSDKAPVMKGKRAAPAAPVLGRGAFEMLKIA